MVPLIELDFASQLISEYGPLLDFKYTAALKVCWPVLQPNGDIGNENQVLEGPSKSNGLAGTRRTKKYILTQWDERKGETRGGKELDELAMHLVADWHLVIYQE